MELKIKILNLDTGVPVAILDDYTACLLGAKAKGRILIEFGSNKSQRLSAIVDVAKTMVGKKELGISSELQKRLSLKNGQKVKVSLSPFPQSLPYIHKKVNGGALSQKEVNLIIKEVIDNSLSEIEISMFISGMYKKGMNMQEIIYLINAILNSGKKLHFKGKYIVDKHCIGGIPGNRTTPLVVSICAAGGLIVPKSSSRAITSAAGTADTVETIAEVNFSIAELKKIVEKTGACLIWGGSLEIVPADEKIISIEKMLSIDPEAQMLASIMSKKLALGAKYILIDIPYGKNAKVDRKKALHLKNKFEYLGRHFNKTLKVVLTKGDEPIGNGIGPALEMVDIIRILNREEIRPLDLEKKALFLAGELFEMTGKAKRGKGIELARQILESGKAFTKFKEIIKAQKGNINRIKFAKFKKDVLIQKKGRIISIDNKKINSLARICGCPADKFAGLYLYKHVGEELERGEKIITIYSESKSRIKEAVSFFNEQNPIKVQNN